MDTAGVPDGAGAAPVVAALRAARSRLVSNGPPPGRAWCQAWTQDVDEAVRALWTVAPHGPRAAVVAVGGYGRRELCPASDVDILLLHDDLDDDAAAALAADVFHPLWDAGCKLGHAVRTPDQLVADALDELDTATAVLDGRVVAGDPEAFGAARAALLRRLDAKPRPYLLALREADRERRFRAGDAAEVLEPDVKNGAGGLRDVQSLRWAAAAVHGASGLDPLAGSGHLDPADVARLRAAEDELLRLRVALHLETGTPTDVLAFERHQSVALRVGEDDGSDDRDTAAHRVLARHFLAARTVEHVHDRVWRRLDSALERTFWPRRRPTPVPLEGLELLDGAVRLPDEADVHDPTLPARLVRALSAGDHVLDRRTATRLREAASSLAVPEVWPDDLRAAFVELLWSGTVLRVTAELDDVGWLVALLPEWAPMRCRPQRSPLHRYSLDRHLVHAVETLGRLVDEEGWAASAVAAVPDRELLAVGVLLHDVGKPFGEPHSETGVPVARAIARRVGLAEEAVDGVERLVRLHLLLPDVATRRDLADAAEIEAVAAAVGDHATLAMLWLLAAADGLATGPSAWTSWKASLVQTLVTKVRAVLDERDPADLADGAAATAAEAVRLGPGLGVAADVVEEHLLQLPERYAAAVPARAVVRHAGLATPQPAPTEVRTRVTPGATAADGVEYDELDVVAVDSPGLFAKVAGVVALHGGWILDAHAHTRADGTAVDTFTVVLPDHATGSWWVSVEGDLVEAVAGRLAVRARVGRKQRSEHRRLAKLPAVTTRVRTMDDAAGRATVVEVHTLDRVGVLYRIASALAELQLDLVVAKVTTLGHEAIDVFTVRDPEGRPLDRDHRSELELAITAALAEEAVAGT